MDHPFPTETLLRSLSAGHAALAARVAGFIGSGGRAVVLLGPPGAGKTAVLETVLSALPGRQMRIGNASTGPLTMKGILRQMGAPLDGMTSGHFFRTLAEQAYDDESATVAVDDAHTLSPYALASLARIPGLGGPELPGMILFLVGETQLLGKLSAPGLELLRNSRRALVLSLPDSVTARAAPETASPARLMWTTLAAEAPEAPPETPAAAEPVLEPELLLISRTGPKAWQPALAGLVLVAAVVMTTLWPFRVGELPTTAPQPAAVETVQSTPPDPAETRAVAPPGVQAIPEPAQTPPADIAPPEPARPLAPSSEAQMRREFDAFLNRAGRDTAKLGAPAREALFREYLAWRAKAVIAAP